MTLVWFVFDADKSAKILPADVKNIRIFACHWVLVFLNAMLLGLG